MSVAKRRNDFLDPLSDSDDGNGGSDDGYQSEDGGRTGRVGKRRKVFRGNRGLSEDEDEDEDDLNPEHSDKDDAENDNHDNDTTSKHTLSTNQTPSHNTPSSKPSKKQKRLKTGIIYLPRLPPFLKPTTLRHLLTPYTKHGINRIFLTPESPSSRKSRLASGGNRKKSYDDGWIEFHSKTDAKTVVAACNGQTMGAGRSKSTGSFYRDDVWAMRYLSGFKWGDLVMERRDEEAEREARAAMERRREKKEREMYLGNVERAKIEETRREREESGAKVLRRREERGGGRVREFRQNEGKDKRVSLGEAVEGRKKLDEGVERVLKRIF